jgi:hypothetical protein
MHRIEPGGKFSSTGQETCLCAVQVVDVCGEHIVVINRPGMDDAAGVVLRDLTEFTKPPRLKWTVLRVRLLGAASPA